MYIYIYKDYTPLLLLSKCRVVIQWLSDALGSYAYEFPDDETLKVMEMCTMLGKDSRFLVRLVDHKAREADAISLCKRNLFF